VSSRELRGHAITRAAAAAAVLLIGAGLSVAADWQGLKPASSAAKVALEVDGRRLSYYRADAESPVSLSIEGPTRLKILTRLRMGSGVAEATYSVRLRRDGEDRRVEELETRPSRSGRYLDDDAHRPGAIRRLYVDVPTGRHEYEIAPAGGTVVDFRVFLETDGFARASVAPIEHGGVETLVHEDRELPYHLARPGARVLLDVVGPTTLTVNTRLLFDRTMIGSQVYIVGVDRSGGEEVLYKMEAKTSNSMTCRDRSDIVPGALRAFNLAVPPGRQTYAFRLADGQGRALALRFLVPRGDLADVP